MSDSWYVETLLRNNLEIKSKIIQRSVVGFEQTEFADLDDIDYNNLLLVESILESLKDNSQLSDKEAIILKRILEHKTISQIRKETGLNRLTISKFTELLCDRVAFILGDMFTNDGYLDFIAKRNGLTDDQLEIARKYMNSNKKYYILTKNNKKGN